MTRRLIATLGMYTYVVYNPKMALSEAQWSAIYRAQGYQVWEEFY